MKKKILKRPSRRPKAKKLAATNDVAARSPLIKPSEEPNPLPEWLRLTPREDDTPEKLEELARRNEKIKRDQGRFRQEAMERGRLSPEAKRVGLGISHETVARTEMEMLEGEISDAQCAREYTSPATIDRLIAARSRLAKALAIQGRYNDAADVEPNEREKARYIAIWCAVHRDDEETCLCEPIKHDGLELNQDYHAEDVLSLTHDRIMPLIICNDCGFMNVRPLTPELERRQDAIDQVAGILRGHDGHAVKDQASDLIPSNLTDRGVLAK